MLCTHVSSRPLAFWFLTEKKWKIVLYVPTWEFATVFVHPIFLDIGSWRDFMSPTLTSTSPPRSRDVISKLAKISFVFEKERKKRKKKSSESRNVWHWCRKNPRDFREWTSYTPENIKQTNVSCLLTFHRQHYSMYTSWYFFSPIIFPFSFLIPKHS